MLPIFQFNDELDRADAVERGDGAAGDDGEIRRKFGDGNEAEIGPGCEQLVSAERWPGVVQGVALSELCRQRRVLEVPHERRGVEKIDGSYADGMG